MFAKEIELHMNILAPKVLHFDRVDDQLTYHKYKNLIRDAVDVEVPASYKIIIEKSFLRKAIVKDIYIRIA